MNCRIVDIKHKEVINVEDGNRIGCVNDVEIDMNSAKVVAIVVFGRLRCFGLFGRYDDIIIGWDKIKVVGEDIILVSHKMIERPKKKFRFLRTFWGD